MNINKEYAGIVNKWKKPLVVKERQKAARAQREAERVPVEAQDAVVYVHSPEQGVSLPAHPNEIYAVIRINGK